MKKLFSVLLILIFLLGFGLYLGVYLGERWINKNLVGIINANPDRNYDISFEKVEYDLFRRVISVNGLRIRPVGKPSGTFVEGEVAQAFLSSFDITKLFFRRILDIQELRFFQPVFQVFIPVDTPEEDQAGEAFQSLFGDILSRGGIRNFQLGNAHSTIFLGDEVIGSVFNLNIVANDLSTDSVQWSHPIPFEYGRIRMSIDSLGYLLTNGQELKIGKVNFDTKAQTFLVEDVMLRFPEGLEAASRKLDFQTDLIEVHLDSLYFQGFEATSNFYSDLDLRAQKLELSGFRLTDFRNKFKPRPVEEAKPMFQGMIQKIGFPLKLDTLLIRNGNITYGENVPPSGEHWDIHFTHLEGTVTRITSIPEYQMIYSHFDAKIKGKIEGKGNLDMDLQVPYDRDEFRLSADFRNFKLTEINAILKPIMNGDIVDGQLHRMNLDIHANPREARVNFVFDYTDLKIELFKKGTQKKNKLLSSVANLALNHSNMPGDRKYLTPSYTLRRNVYRGPFYLMWQSTKEGMLNIVPGGAAKDILRSSEK